MHFGFSCVLVLVIFVQESWQHNTSPEGLLISIWFYQRIILCHFFGLHCFTKINFSIQRKKHVTKIFDNYGENICLL